MCKFEQIGVERQYTSVTKEDANRNFRISCTICCNRGMHLECDRCAISTAHDLMIATYNDLANNKEEV